MSFSSCGDPTDTTERSRASSESASEFSTSTQTQPLVKRSKNGPAEEELSPLHARHSSARQVILGGNCITANNNGCHSRNNLPDVTHRSVDNEEIYENESCDGDENQDAEKKLPVLMVTSC